MATAQATALPPNLQIHASDRLGLTIFFAVVLHSLIILGISFAQPDEEKPPEKLPGLDVTLVQSKTDTEIKDADFRANENQEGGGKSSEAERAASPIEPIVATGKPGEVAVFNDQIFVPEASEKSRMEVITAFKSDKKLVTQDNTKEVKSNSDNKTAAQLLTANKEIAQTSAELALLQQKYKKRKNRAFMSAATMASKYASYEDSWRKKIEQTGTLNFPDKARRQKLSGDVRVSVTIRKDGTVVNIKVTKFSGHKVLDDAASRIVKLAAPFSPFPKNLADEFDELTIVRTFQFLQGSKLQTRAN
ncbi:MAG: energy transducer TonB [Thiohalomonadales bacterium]